MGVRLSKVGLILACGYAAATETGIRAFAFDAQHGTLEARGALAGIVNPSFLVAHPNRRWLYAVSETGVERDGAAGSVWALRMDPAARSIQAVNRQPSGGDWPCHLLVDATARWLLVSNYGSGSAAVLPIGPDGALGEPADRVQHRGRGVNPARQESPHAHSTILTPDNRFAVVADLGIDRLAVYRFDAKTGRLSPRGETRARAGAGPRHMAFHPDGRRLYVANELDSTVTAYEYDSASGSLREVQTVDTLPPGAPENTAADIHITASGGHLFVSNRGHNSIAVFAVERDGLLTTARHYDCGGNWPRNFTLAAGERFLVVANQYSGELSVLPLSESRGEVGAPVARAQVPQAACVQYCELDVEASTGLR